MVKGEVMKVPQKFFPEKPALQQPLQGQERTGGAKGSASLNATRFASVLDNLVENRLWNSLSLSSDLGKTQLQEIARLVSAQMQQFFVQALSTTNTGNSEPADPSWMYNFVINIEASAVAVNQMHSGAKSSEGNAPRDYDIIIDEAARAYDVDARLIRSVIRAESGFNAGTTSPKGAMGLMQIMPDTARELGLANPYDPRENIMAGTRYLKALLERYDGNVNLALGAYNWGMGNIERHPEHLPRETREYIARVTSYMEKA